MGALLYHIRMLALHGTTTVLRPIREKKAFIVFANTNYAFIPKPNFLCTNYFHFVSGMLRMCVLNA